MDMFTHDRLIGRRGMLRLTHGSLILELGSLGRETLLDVITAAVVDFAVLDVPELVRVFLREDFTVLDGLDGGVVVVLMDFAVDGGGCALVLGAGYVFVLDGGVHSLWRRLGGDR